MNDPIQSGSPTRIIVRPLRNLPEDAGDSGVGGVDLFPVEDANPEPVTAPAENDIPPPVAEYRAIEPDPPIGALDGASESVIEEPKRREAGSLYDDSPVERFEPEDNEEAPQEASLLGRFFRRGVATPIPQTGRRIVRGHSDEGASLGEKAHDLYTQLYDDLHPIKRIDEESYRLMRLTRGNPGRSHQFLNNSTYDYNTHQNIGPSFKDVIRPVAQNDQTLNAFEDFAVAMRDIELHGRGIDPGRGLPDAQAVVANAPPEFRQTLGALKQYQDQVLQYLIDSGVVSPEAATAMRQANQHYVPFHRLHEAGEIGIASRNVKAFNPIKRIGDSNRDILSPLETIVRNTDLFIGLAEKNRALQSLGDAVVNNGITGVLHPVGRGTHPVRVTRDEIERFFTNNGVPVPSQFYGAPDSFSIFRPNALRPARDEIAIYRNGRPEVFRVDQDVADAINGMGPQQIDMLTRIVGAPARLLRSGVVYDPSFLAKNPARDQLTAAVQSNSLYVPVLSWLHGLGHMMAKSNTYQDFLKSGAAQSNLVSMDRKYIEEEINNLAKAGVFRNVKNVVNPIQFFRILSELGEQPTRVGEFAQSRMLGRDLVNSGYQAREVSVDFSRRGSSQAAKFMGQVAEFFNPALQGPDRFVRAALDDPGKMAFKAALFLGLPTLSMYFANRQDPRMASIPDHERDNFWHAPTDDWKEITAEEFRKIPEAYRKEEGGKHFINMGTIWKMPKNFEIGVGTASAVERTLDKWFMENPDDFKKIASFITGVPVDQVNADYFKNRDSAWKGYLKSLASVTLPPMLPRAAVTPIEVASNFSLWRGRPIVTDRVKSPQVRQYEYTPYTSEAGKYIGSLVSKINPENVFASPQMIDYSILAWTGGLGRLALDAIDKVVRGGENPIVGKWSGIRERTTGKEEPSRPTPTLADYPVAKVFVSRLPTPASRQIMDFYDNYEAARGSQTTLRRLARNKEDVKKFKDEADPINLKKIADAMSAQARVIDKLMISDDKLDPKSGSMIKLTPDEKRHLITIATLNMVMWAERGNNIMRAAKIKRENRVKKDVVP